MAMRQVRESGDYGIWIRFFIKIAETAVAILEKLGVIKEISNKQRYRVYCYENLIREILK